MPTLVDSHCHLDFPDFEEEIPAVVARARAAGVTRMVTICTRLRQAPQVQAIAEAHPEVYWAAGTHPMHAAEEPMAMNPTSHAPKRSVERVGRGVFVTGRRHASAVTARSERRSAADW